MSKATWQRKRRGLASWCPTDPAWLGVNLHTRSSSCFDCHAMCCVEAAISECERPVPAVIRIAAKAALLVLGKYYALSDDSEVYRIAIVMCPDKKVEWFKSNPDWRPDDAQEVERITIQRWTNSYANLDRATPKPTTLVAQQNLPKPKSIWASSLRTKSQASITHDPDSIEAYLSAPQVSTEDIQQAGGILKYWEQARKSRPRLARMALDFLTAPASSVDAERSFSSGRLQINHLQHNMSPGTFQAQMAIGSWYGTPLMPDLTKAIDIIKTKSVKGPKHEPEKVNKGKARVVEVMEIDD